MTSLSYGIDMPYEVQLEYDAAISTRHMTILEPQRSPGQVATRHLLTPGVYMISLTYNGAAAVALRHEGQNLTNSLHVPTGTRGVPRTSAPMKISVHGTTEYMHVEAPATDESARATISVIPAATFDEMEESAQGVSVLSEINTLKTTKADKSTLDARVPADTSLRLDTTVGTRIFAGDTMIYGDTGRVNLILSEGWGGSRFELNRTGDIVELEGRVQPTEITAGSALSDLIPLAQIPAGFRPIASVGSHTPAGQAYILIGVGRGTMGTLFFAEGQGLSVRMSPSADGSWATNHHLLVHAMWRTTNSWPTSL